MKVIKLGFLLFFTVAGIARAETVTYTFADSESNADIQLDLTTRRITDFVTRYRTLDVAGGTYTSFGSFSFRTIDGVLHQFNVDNQATLDKLEPKITAWLTQPVSLTLSCHANRRQTDGMIFYRISAISVTPTNMAKGACSIEQLVTGYGVARPETPPSARRR